MKNSKMRNRIILYVAVLCVCMLYNSKVYAISGVTQKVITPGKIKEWDDGATVTQESVGKGEEYNLSVSADTSGLEQGYYSVYHYDYTSRSIVSFDGMKFHLLNSNDIEMKINLSFAVNSKESVELGDSSYAILESESQGIREMINVSYGTISIPANFDGTVYIPFSQLYTEQGETVTLKKMQSWGITTVWSENQQINYSLGNIAFLSKSVALMKESYFLMNIQGDNEISVPKTGSIIKNYSTKIKDMVGNEVNQNLTYYLAEDVTGINLSKTGRLEVSSECDANEITIYVKSDQSVTYGKMTVVLRHNAMQQTMVGVPSANAVSHITTNIFTKLNQNIFFVRIMLGIILLVFFSIIYDWFQVSKTNYETIKKTLDTSSKNQEEEEEQ